MRGCVTYYSDLLVVIDEIDALKHGMNPRRSVSELRGLCDNILAVDPDEELAAQLLVALRDLHELHGEVDASAIRIYLFEKFRWLTRPSPSAH